MRCSRSNRSISRFNHIFPAIRFLYRAEDLWPATLFSVIYHELFISKKSTTIYPWSDQSNRGQSSFPRILSTEKNISMGAEVGSPVLVYLDWMNPAGHCGEVGIKINESRPRLHISGGTEKSWRVSYTRTYHSPFENRVSD